MGIDFDSFQDVLKHPIRRKIILALSEHQALSYMDLMIDVEATNTGKFNYHLKILSDLILKDPNSKYELTEKGRLAAQFLQTFKEKKVEPKPFRMSDALLIGFVGFVLTLCNPGYWSFLLAVNSGIKSIPIFLFLEVLSLFFGLVLPGAVMWRLTVRRSHSHDNYDLYKAPILAFAMLLPLFVAMLLFNVPMVTQASIITQRASGINWSSTHTIIIPMSLVQIVFYGLPLSFAGVALAEGASQLKRRLRR
jgi:hypothetical protein